MVSRREKRFRTVLQKNARPQAFSPEVEHLLDILAQIEARRQLRLRTLERKSVNAASKIPS